MKLLHILFNEEGKMNLTTPQMLVGLAAVGAVGLSAYYMTANQTAEPDAQFSSQDEIVYVANGYGADSRGRGLEADYSEGGRPLSAMQVRQSNTARLMNNDRLRAKAAGQNASRLDQQEQAVQSDQIGGAHKMSQTTGLGLGNDVDMKELNGMGDLSAIQAQIDAIQAAAASKAQQANGDVAAAAAAAAQGKTGAAGASGKWGRNPNMATANGTNLNSTPLQAAGDKSGGALGGAKGADGRLAMSGRTSRLQGNRDASFRRAGEYEYRGNSLANIQKHSADVAGNSNRSVNEAAGAFFGSKVKSAGILWDNDTIETPLATTDDYKQVDMPNMSGFAPGADAYAEAQDELKEHLKSFKKKLQWCSNIPLWGSRTCFKHHWKNMKKNIENFGKTWGQEIYEKNNTQGSYAGRMYDVADELYKYAKKCTRGLLGIAGNLGIGMMTINHKYKKLLSKLDGVEENENDARVGGGAGMRPRPILDSSDVLHQETQNHRGGTAAGQVRQ